MQKKRLDAILYVVLSIVLLLYLVFNAFSMGGRTGPATAVAGGYFNKTRPVKGDSGRKYVEKASDSAEGVEKTDSLTEPQQKNGDSPEPAGNSGSLAEPQQNGTEDKPDINPKGFHLYVDLDRTLMYVYKDGELLTTYEVSGGKASSPSPTGTWKIVSKDTWGEGFGGAWLGFNVPWGMYGIHGTKEPWFVGRSNASKGCIRMRNDDVKELYNMVPYNTAVTIIHKNKPFHTMKDGDIGSDVLEVEKALKMLGYYHGSEDGTYGAALTTAVKEFQKNHRLYRTGIVNISTYELMMQMARELE